MMDVKLPGLDAQNPLAFLAALGLLVVVDDHARRAERARPRLRFLDEGRQVPILTSDHDLDSLIGLVLEDAGEQASSPALGLAYDEDGNLVSSHAPGATRDLKPPPAAAREHLLRCSRSDRRAADLAAAFFSELVRDGKGNTKPMSFHFTAGQQAFLEMVGLLREGIDRDDIREALEGPWQNSSTLPSLSWDASVSRLYALRASDPSKEKRGSVPGANWLAVQGLSFFPVAVLRNRLVTTGVEGGWKSSTFRWPVWGVPAGVYAIRSLLRADTRRWTERERAAVGISAVFSARILRSDQGGYGSFSPAEVVLPR